MLRVLSANARHGFIVGRERITRTRAIKPVPARDSFLDFEENILPTSLKYLLHEVVFKLINEKFAEYLNLLYIIDVSEEKIKQLDGSDALKLSDQVTFLILQREWQKVWYRNAYS